MPYYSLLLHNYVIYKNIYTKFIEDYRLINTQHK